MFNTYDTPDHERSARSAAINELYSGEGATPKDQALAASFFSEQEAVSRVSDLELILSYALRAEGRHADQNIMIWGPPGVGKTQLVKEVCEKHGARCVVMMLNMLEPTDLKGLPVPNRDTGRVDYMLMSDFPPSDSQDLWVLFLDELNTATPETLNAAMRLILERRVDGYQLPPRTVIIAAGNRQSDRALVETLPSPMSNRLLHINYLPLITEWCEWAEKAELSEIVIDFIRDHGELLIKTSHTERGWPSPRSWARLSQQFKLAGLLALTDRRYLLLVAQGCVGAEAGAMFVDFIETYAHRGDPSDFIDLPRMPFLITEERPDLRLSFLREVALYVTQELQHSDLERCERKLNGLFERLLTLPEAEGRLLIGSVAELLPQEAHGALTQHPRFAEVLERYKLIGLKEISFGAAVEFLSRSKGMSDAMREVLRGCLKEAA